MNAKLLNKIQGENNNFFSMNMTNVKDQTLKEYSTELLQRINLASLLLLKLSLKIDASIILLCNLDQLAELNNSSKMIIEYMRYHIIAATLMNGNHNREMRFIPQIPLTSLKGDLTFILTCRQVPIQLYFAITINKSQGQMLQITGLDLWVFVFTYKQLYVALFCATNVSNLTVLFSETAERKMVNIVYPKMLKHMQKNPKVVSFVVELCADGN